MNGTNFKSNLFLYGVSFNLDQFPPVFQCMVHGVGVCLGDEGRQRDGKRCGKNAWGCTSVLGERQWDLASPVNSGTGTKYRGCCLQ